jgi:hypothetical protein
MAATPTRFPYRLTRDVMVAAAVLYCSLLLELAAGFPAASLLLELAAGFPAASLLLELAAGFPATSTLAGIGSVAMGIFAGSRYWSSA